VLEDGAAGVADGEHGEDAHGAAAGVAAQDVDREHALHQRGPGEPTERAGASSGEVVRSGGIPWHDGGTERVVGCEYGDLDKHAEAITAWEKALGLSPDRVDTVYNLAQARFFLKEFEAALVGFQTVARLDPDDFMTTRKIAQCLYALERYDEGAAARVRFREQWSSTHDPRARFLTEYVFDQFQADGFWVHALETLRPRTPSVYVLLTFQAIEIHGHHDHALPAAVTVETSDQAKQAGTPFVFGVKAGRQFRVVGMSKDLPPYPELKTEVVRLLAEALRPPAKA